MYRVALMAQLLAAWCLVARAADVESTAQAQQRLPGADVQDGQEPARQRLRTGYACGEWVKRHTIRNLDSINHHSRSDISSPKGCLDACDDEWTCKGVDFDREDHACTLVYDNWSMDYYDGDLDYEYYFEVYEKC